MSEKITLPGLVAKLAGRTGDTKRETEEFLKELFSLIASELEKGEPVKVYGLGVFKTISVEPRKSVDVNTGNDQMIPAHRKVVFMPSKELAALVNEPFSMFQTIELPEDIEISETEETEQPEVIVTETSMAEEQTTEMPEPEAPLTEEETKEEPVSEEPAAAEEPVAEVPAAEEPAAEAPVAEDPVASTEEESAEEIIEVIEEVEEDDEEPCTPKKKKRKHMRNYWLGFGTGFVAACLIILLAWNLYGIVRMSNENAIKQQHERIAMADSIEMAARITDSIAKREAARTLAHADSIAGERMNPGAAVAEKPAQTAAADTEVAPTKPSDQKQYDTITKTRYLTTMAKDHYGNYHLWPYIYKENAAFLGHPDRIRPGTRVVIPDLKKYGINPDNPADIAKAKQLGTQIYAKYK